MLEPPAQVFKYRGRTLSAQDITFIRDLITRHPSVSRYRLSVLLCEAWNWRQPIGIPSGMLARGFMLALERAGHITLPPPRRVIPNNALRRRSPQPWLLDTSAIEGKLSELQPLEFRLVRRTPQEALFDSLIHYHHYLGYTRPVGEHLKYLVFAKDGRPVAALAFSSAPRHLGPRDRFLGWPAIFRRANIRLVAYNPRFLVLPWVRVPHLASHVLARVTRRLSADWHTVYGHPVHFVETFVDPTRFKGTCYRAANWVYMGLTTGRGKQSNSYVPNRSLKEVLGYPLVADFRKLLQAPS
jgi:hypothetical protein